MKDYKIACVIVTYNRKELLKNCLDAVASQTFKLHTVYITDNASTDGTMESVKEWGYYECERDGIRFKYILNSKNEGGAGGFYLGMKTAHQEGLYDGIWVMDDDGVPEKDCLQKLCDHLVDYDYIAPIVLDVNDDESLSFEYNGKKNIGAIMKEAVHGLVSNFACPMNGILFSRRLISDIGYPKKEMFIWGDEANYDLRAKKKGYIPITVAGAIHRHPSDRQIHVIGLGGKRITVIDVPWKWFVFCRNFAYNRVVDNGKLKSIYGIFLFYIRNMIYLIKQGKYDLFAIMNRALYKGYVADFEGWEKYKTDKDK